MRKQLFIRHKGFNIYQGTEEIEKTTTEAKAVEPNKNSKKKTSRK